MAFRLLTLAALTATALAKTDLEGCTYIDAVVTVSGRHDIAPYATRTWYVEDTGEICEFLDCGGGRAPPKTTVPGCGAYKGTETYSPRFMPSTTAAADEPEETEDSDDSDDGDSKASDSGDVTTPAPTRSGEAPQESGSGSEDGGSEDGDDEDSGAGAMGVSIAGVVAAAAALGLF